MATLEDYAAPDEVSLDVYTDFECRSEMTRRTYRSRGGRKGPALDLPKHLSSKGHVDGCNEDTREEKKKTTQMKNKRARPGYDQGIWEALEVHGVQEE